MAAGRPSKFPKLPAVLHPVVRGLLFKRNAYNFVSLAHHGADIEGAMGTLDEVLQDLC